jgi:flagellar assembly factor FliW
MYSSAPATVAPATPVDSALLGPLEVPPDAVYEFPAGLYAFAGARRFALVPAGREGLFWLQSLDDAALVFLLADPFAHRADYAADLPDADVGALGATGAPGELAVLAIVTLPAERGGTPTVNLRAPVVLHAHTRLGRQLVLQDDRWGMTEPVDLRGAG